MKNSIKTGIILIICLAISSCSLNFQKQQLEGFDLENDFEKNSSLFLKDTFNVAGYSTEGGEIIVYQSKKKNYKVLDVWLYDEIGKRNTRYYTDVDFNFKLVVQNIYLYDKPAYLSGYKTKILKHYFIYKDTLFSMYTNNNEEIRNEEIKLKKRKNIEIIFKNATENQQFKKLIN